MREIWFDRTPREQALISCAGFVAALLLLNIFLVRPMIAAKASASDALLRETRTLDLVVRATKQANVAGQVSSTVHAEPALRSGLIDLAQARGLSVSRLQSGKDGEISVEFDAASPQLIFSWLSDVESQFGALPLRASIFADTGDSVRASIQFKASNK